MTRNAALRKSMAEPVMSETVPMPLLTTIREVPGKGRGVFATCAIAAGTVIEIAPVLVLKASEVEAIAQTMLDDYVFEWIDPRDAHLPAPDRAAIAVALGIGSMFNHDSDPDAGFRCDHASRTIVYTALRDITAGQEICIDYDIPLWFDAKD